jgi:hypothetical protein
MTPEFQEPFAQHYACLLKRLKPHALQPQTIALYSHGVRRAGLYFACQIDALTRTISGRSADDQRTIRV